MFISNLMIDTGDNPDQPRPGRLWLRNLYHVHQRLCMAFPSKQQKENDPDFIKPYQPTGFPNAQTHEIPWVEKNHPAGPLTENHVHAERSVNEGFLFRIDPLPTGRAMITIQSAFKPDWDYAFHNADFLLAAPPAVFDYLPDPQAGQSYRFRLTANPTRKIDTKTRPDGTKSNGKRVPVSRDDLPGWLKSKGEEQGFIIDEAMLDIQTGFVYASAGKNDTPKRFFSARYQGVLTVTDADVFGKTLVGGIGPAKGFGFGLLSIAPVKEQL